jgi:adenosylhomocysteine nucleosidase
MIGIVTGLLSEAGCIPPSVDRLIVSTGGEAPRARQAASVLVDRGARALLSFGLAGGLDRETRPGDLLLPEAVVLPGGAKATTDSTWRARLEAKLFLAGPAVHGGLVAGSDGPLVSVDDKHRLHDATGAIGVDMESPGVAEAALHARLPFVVLRAIADPVTQRLPHAARRALAPDGSIRVLVVARGLLDRPQDFPALLRVWRQSARAHASLRCAALLAGPALEPD